MTRAAGTRPADAVRPALAGFLDLARRRLRRTIIVVGLSWILTFAFAQEIMVLLAQPLTHAWENHRAELGAPALHFSALVEPFWVYMTLAFWIGLFVASPFLFHQLWRALTRLRSPGRRGMATPFAAATTLCFAVGAAFCYFVVLPLAFDFFLGYASQNLAHMSSALGLDVELGKPLALKPALYLEPYLALTIRMLVAFGLVFELPIAILFLSSIGLVTHRSMWRFNRWAIVLAFVIAAVLTPGPDIVSQVAMAVPLVVLYNLSILIALVMTRRRELRADAS
ncbi:MAG TPA: twin-arginine translocase subunit TatC [Kofleriaceae bacterium]|nr:twin-arginine translocase subunit TatC [Kofleriaceae bacterium]